MTDNLAVPSDSFSSLYVGVNGQTEAFAGADDEELSTVAKRFLVAETNRLVEENQQLRQFKEKYHDADKKLAVLRETIKSVRNNLFLSSVSLIAGSAGVAAAPFLAINQYCWYLFVLGCAMLLISGIVVRFEGPSSASK